MGHVSLREVLTPLFISMMLIAVLVEVTQVRLIYLSMLLWLCQKRVTLHQ